MKKIIACIVLNIAIAATALAQDISFEASVDARKIFLDSSLTLSLVIRGKQNVSAINLPDMDSFDAEYMGVSRQVSIVNGKYTNSNVFSYRLYPRQTGQFTIPALRLQLDGLEYETDSIPVEVIATPASGIPARANPGSPTSFSDKIFLVLKASKNEVYLNEGLPVKIMLFSAGLTVRNITYPQLNTVGFTIKDFTSEQYQQLVKGVKYNIIEFDTVLYPTRTGEVTLGPVKIDCNVLMQSPSRRSSYQGLNSIFDDDFFNSFFDQAEKRPVSLESKGVVIRVLDLPQEGRPDHFSGGVGVYEFNVQVSPTQVNVGDPITLRMTIRGDGNLDMVNFPGLKNQDQFKVYDPIIKVNGSTKSLEQVIIPTSEDITEVPAIAFFYFDDDLKKYRTITKGPFDIEVIQSEADGDLKIVGLTRLIESNILEPESLGRDIVFIKEYSSLVRTKGQRFYKGWLYPLLLFVVSGGWIWLYLRIRREAKLKTDGVYARGKHASKKAKKGLVEARKLIGLKQGQAFYDVLFKTLQSYLSGKLNLASGKVAYTTIVAHPKITEKHADMAREIKAFVEQCDSIRYASGQVKEEDMKESYHQVERIIDYLERSIK